MLRAVAVAWRILARVADAFMTVDEDDAVATMKRLANPIVGDPAVVRAKAAAWALRGSSALCGSGSQESFASIRIAPAPKRPAPFAAQSRDEPAP
ncbi:MULTISPECIES: hypothetical protein [Rhizobium]|uniref:hypothetical protein n=1 Tax=Rhizobium leucaenae TaxID=29450 RepID=UPI0003A42A77